MEFLVVAISAHVWNPVFYCLQLIRLLVDFLTVRIVIVELVQIPQNIISAIKMFWPCELNGQKLLRKPQDLYVLSHCLNNIIAEMQNDWLHSVPLYISSSFISFVIFLHLINELCSIGHLMHLKYNKTFCALIYGSCLIQLLSYKLQCSNLFARMEVDLLKSDEHVFSSFYKELAVFYFNRL